MERVMWLIRKYGVFILTILTVLLIAGVGAACFRRWKAEQARWYEHGYSEMDMDAAGAAESNPEDSGAKEDEEILKGGKAIKDGNSGHSVTRADACLITEAERKQLQDQALSAAESVGGIHRNATVRDVPDLFAGVYELTDEQQKAVVEELGKNGWVSVGEGLDMQNYEKVETFYDDYMNGRDSMATIFNVQEGGLAGSVTFIHRNDRIQTYYVGIRWEEDGIPVIDGTSVNEVAELKLTEKGYLIYAYERVIAHGSLREYWRVRPVSEKCRELTEKYISGLSYVNYNMLVTDWDAGNVEDILMPCMFEDIYRIDTGENLTAENWKVPARQYEKTMTTYFPVSTDQLRACCGYDADSDSYPYEMIYAVPHPPFGEVTDYTENEDGTITLVVDGVWPDYNSDHAFTNRIRIQPFADGTFRYLSNSIEQGELEIPGREVLGGQGRMETGKKEMAKQKEMAARWKMAAMERKESLPGLKAAEQWTNGYNLPITRQERKEAETDCKNVMALLRDLYEQAEKGETSNVVLSDETILKMRDKAAETGRPVYTVVLYADMENHEQMERFLKTCAEGKAGSLVTYVIRRNGGIGRIKYLFDGTAMYALSANAVWNEKAESGMSIIDISQTRIRKWHYSGKGWFCYELCVPEYPEVTEAVNGSRLIRVRPMAEELREMSVKCVLGLGYQGNNLLCSNWDAEHLEGLDFNGAYEYLYAMKYGEKFAADADSPNGIPGEEFESLMMEYLPVTAEQIRKYAVWNGEENEEKRTYAWVGLGCGNYAPTFFGTSLPEATDIRYHGDGTVTLTVDAVCGMMMCDDAVITHELTVEFDGSGGFRYLGNKILNDGIKDIPVYQYRMGMFWES